MSSCRSILFVALSCFFSLPPLSAQWVQTAGPEGWYVQCLTVKGNTLLAGTYGNGVLLSTNGGASWIALRNGLTHMCVKDMREVAVLVNGKKEPGRYAMTFDAAGVAGGVYLCRLEAGGLAAIRKMLLIR